MGLDVGDVVRRRRCARSRRACPARSAARGCGRADASRARGPRRRRRSAARCGDVRSSGATPRSGRDSGKWPPARRSSFVDGRHAGLDEQCGHAGEPVLVVRRRQVVRRVHALDAVAEHPAVAAQRTTEPTIRRNTRRSQSSAKTGSPAWRSTGPKPSRPPRSWTPSTPRIYGGCLLSKPRSEFEPFDGRDRANECVPDHNTIGVTMHSHVRSSVIAGVAVAGIGALTVAPLAPPPESYSPPTAVHEVRPPRLPRRPWVQYRWPSSATNSTTAASSARTSSASRLPCPPARRCVRRPSSGRFRRLGHSRDRSVRPWRR